MLSERIWNPGKFSTLTTPVSEALTLSIVGLRFSGSVGVFTCVIPPVGSMTSSVNEYPSRCTT